MATRAAPQTLPVRTVALGGDASAAVWLLEMRALSVPPTIPPQLHAALERRVRTMRSVTEWQMTSSIHPARQEVVVQLVTRRRTAAHRGDNVFLAWSRVIARVFSLDATLLRRVWISSALLTHQECRPVRWRRWRRKWDIPSRSNGHTSD
jgi:hypothetical protein